MYDQQCSNPLKIDASYLYSKKKMDDYYFRLHDLQLLLVFGVGLPEKVNQRVVDLLDWQQQQKLATTVYPLMVHILLVEMIGNIYVPNSHSQFSSSFSL